MHDQLSIARPVELDWTAPIADTPLATGLAALWSACPHGGAVLFDLAGPHHARGSGDAIQWRTDVAGGWAPSFDATYHAAGSGVNLGGGPFTLLVLHVPADAFNAGVFGFSVGSYNFSLFGGGDVQFHLDASGTGGSIVGSTGGIVTGVSQVWAASQAADGATRLYVDGVVVGTGTTGGPLIAAGAGDFTIGQGTANYSGTIPLVALWRRRLTDAEVWDASKNPWQLLRRPRRKPVLLNTGLSAFGLSLTGAARTLNAFTVRTIGLAKVGYASYGLSAGGQYRLLEPFGLGMNGTASVLNSFASRFAGQHAVTSLSSYGLTLAGRHAVFAARRLGLSGQYRFVVSCRTTIGGNYRVANDALARYELYRGIDGAPDFSAAPYETFTTLPHTTAAQDPDTNYQYAVRRRNAWGLVSQNMDAIDVQLDSLGEVVPVPPSPPTDTAIAVAAGGTALITARYEYDADAGNQADRFLIYQLVSGPGGPLPSWPPLGSLTPVVVTMEKALGGSARLRYTTDGYLEGQTVRVVVRTRRSGTPDVDSTNGTTPEFSVVVTLLGPDAVGDAELFIGTAAEQDQG